MQSNIRLLITLLLLLSTNIFAQQNVINLNDSESVQTVTQNISYLLDNENKLTIEDISQTPVEHFIKPAHEILNFGNDQVTIWIRVECNKPTEDLNKWFLLLKTAFITDSEFYSRNEQQKWTFTKTGRIYPFSDRLLQRPNFYYELPSFQDKEVFYIKVVGYYLQFPIKIGTPKAYWKEHHTIDIGYGVFYGFIILIAIYNLFLYISVREKVYLLYILSVVFNGMTQSTLHGHASEFLWGESTWINLHSSIIPAFTGLFTSLFTISFLNLRKEVPLYANVFKGLIGVYALSIIINIFQELSTLTSLINQATILVHILFTLFVAYKLIKRGFSPAKFFFIAWLLYLSSLVVYILASLNIIEYHSIYAYAPMFGIAIEIVLLSLALAEKIKLYKEQKEDAQQLALDAAQKNEQLIKEQNTILENKVIERTEELQQINDELSITLETVNDQTKLIEKKNNDITASITYAQRIQQSMLPLTSRIKKVLPEHFILFKPRDIVSGDFYWIQQVDDKKVIAAVDCTGHGVPGAFMSLIGNDLLNEIVLSKKITNPSKILETLNHKIISTLKQENTDNQDGMDAAICVIDTTQNKVRFAGAKNPFILIQNGELQEYKGDRKSIGGSKKRIKEEVFSYHDINLEGNNIGYLFSDGYMDQFGGENDKKFMKRRFINLLHEIHHLPMKEQEDILEKRLKEWIGHRAQIDDILVIGFQF